MNKLKALAIILCVCIFNPVVSFAQISKNEALSEFVSAGMAYKEGRYDAAINHYQSILDGGLVSGPVYYNLGNAYYKKRDFGNAILNYERAKKYIPRDSDLNFNSAYARSRIDQYGSDEDLSLIDQTEKSFIQYYTVDEMVIIIVTMIIVIGIIYLAGLYFRIPQSVGSGLTTVSLIGLLVFSAGLISKINNEHNLAVITAKSDSYFEPREDSTVHFKLSEGMKVKVLKSELHWFKVERLDGKVGWVDRTALQSI